MVQELLPFIPQAISDELAAACVVAMCAGAFLWLCGASWSRGIVALLGVAIGGFLGMLLPRMFEWPKWMKVIAFSFGTNVPLIVMPAPLVPVPPVPAVPVPIEPALDPPVVPPRPPA